MRAAWWAIAALASLAAGVWLLVTVESWWAIVLAVCAFIGAAGFAFTAAEEAKHG